MCHVVATFLDGGLYVYMSPYLAILRFLSRELRHAQGREHRAHDVIKRRGLLARLGVHHGVAFSVIAFGDFRHGDKRWGGRFRWTKRRGLRV
jgi:hypothetical protein